MTAIEKERIFVQLRQYHLEEFPETFASAAMTDLFDEYKIIEEDAISMLLSLVNGKTGFVDYSSELDAFKEKITVTPKTEKIEKDNLALFALKAGQLSDILKIGELSTFMIKVPRNGPRQVGKAVTTKTTRS